MNLYVWIVKIMRGADCAKNMESAPKKYLAEKIAKNTNQKHNIPPALKSRGFSFIKFFEKFAKRG